MALDYKHSALFQHLKQIEETIKDNYSSAQYIDVLDKLLFKSIKPIILYTDFLNNLLVELMHLSIINHRRKVSNLSKENFITLVFSFLVSEKEDQYKIVKKMKLERTFIMLVITLFLKELNGYYETLQLSSKGDASAKEHKKEIDASVGLVKGKSLWTIYLEVSNYFDTVKDFKKQIIEKYIRHTLTAAQTHYKLNDSKMELDEIIQTMFVYVSHAIDKYDQTKGTLTSYISTWLQHARNQSSVNELETSFILPHAKRSEIKNASVSLDLIEKLEVEDEEINDDIVRVRQLAKIADPLGFARIALDIQEHLNREEIMLQKSLV